MKLRPNYCSFYGPDTVGLQGQQNLSRAIRSATSSNFEINDLSQTPTRMDHFPSLFRVLAAAFSLWLRRLTTRRRSGGVTVLDMIHSVTVLPKEHATDKLIIIGHDSYALRTMRELRAAQGAKTRLRLWMSALGWRCVELMLRNMAWHFFFASPIDFAYAASGYPGGVIAIPVDHQLIEIGKKLRNRPISPRIEIPKVLVSLPVVNPSQNRIDSELVTALLKKTKGIADVTLWGPAAPAISNVVNQNGQAHLVEWVEDYAGFLSSFDLLVYSRMVGSGFHTKLAEALVLGVPCVCVDWIAAPLIQAGYGPLITYSKPAEFVPAVARAIQEISNGAPRRQISPNAYAEVALAPLIEICREALEAP